MKYFLLLLFAACTQPESRKGKLILGQDSTGITSGPTRITILPDTTVKWTGPGKYYHLRMVLDGASLTIDQDTVIEINGDTMKIIKGLLLQMEQKQRIIDDMRKVREQRQEDSVAYYTHCIDSLSYYERLIDKYINIAKEAQSRSVNRRTMETDFKQMNKATEYWLKASICRVKKGLISSKIDDYFARH
jgi:hypothetical protein